MSGKHKRGYWKTSNYDRDIASASNDGKPALSASVGKLTTSFFDGKLTTPSFDGNLLTSPPGVNTRSTSSMANSLESHHVLNTKKLSSVATSKNHNVGASSSSSIKEINQRLLTTNSWDDADTVCSFSGEPSSPASFHKSDEKI
eukprot:9138281-Ditylum_brightwellii.AAC.1